MRTTALMLAMSAGATALAGEVVCPDCAVLTIDGKSSAEVGVYFDTFLGSDSPDPANVGVFGTVVIEADDFEDPSTLRLHSLNITLDPPASFSGSADFDSEFGFADYTFILSGVTYSGVPISNDAGKKETGLGFSFSDFQVTLAGSDSADYDIVGVGTDSQIGLLIGGNPYEASLVNVQLSADDENVSLSASLEITPFGLFYEPGLVELQVQSAGATLNASGENPQGVSCCSLADIAEPYGLLDLADIVAFATAFSDMTEAGDIDDNGLFDLADITGFITLFGEGCKDTSPAYCYFSDENYAGIQFHTGNPAYAMGEHRTMTAGLALGGAALMLGFAAFRRRGS